MIQLEHISKKFKKKTVLNDISYTFESGKIYGIYGINGSGKTMLLRIISGLVFPTSGSIIINGKTLHKEISFPDHMGLIIENMELQPQLTAFENLEELNKINHYATTSDIQDALRKINLQSNEKVKKFSLGMKQKLNIAQAIFENPRLLLLDEPTNALDSDAIEHLKAILEDLKKKNIKMAVASSTRYERVLSNLKSIKVDHYFDAIIGGDQIQHGKPAPDIFLKAVELLGVSKEDALVLEDSKNGILAAHAGNIPVICIPDLIHHSKDILDLTVGCYDSLDQLIDVIVKKDDKA